MRNFLKLWLPWFFWVSFIFYLSLQGFLPSPIAGEIGLVLRKIGHSAVYAVLFWLTIRLLKEYLKTIKIAPYLLALIFAVLLAITDEYIQSFSLSRSGNRIDVMIDIGGIIIALLFSLFPISPWRDWK